MAAAPAALRLARPGISRVATASARRTIGQSCQVRSADFVERDALFGLDAVSVSGRISQQGQTYDAGANRRDALRDSFLAAPMCNISQTLAASRPHAHCQSVHKAQSVSVQQLLANGAPHRAAKFVQMEVPKRFDIAMGMIERLSGWSKIQEFVELHESLERWAHTIRTTKRNPEVGLKPLTRCVNRIRRENQPMLVNIVRGAHQLDYDIRTIDAWLDEFLTLRIGANMLMHQYASRVHPRYGGAGKPTGAIDLNCDVRAESLKAATNVSRICSRVTGEIVPFQYEESAANESQSDAKTPCTLPYFPAYLNYALMELMKNSFKATATVGQTQDNPVHIRAASNGKTVDISITDTAGGIPLAATDKIWSYGYGAAAKTPSDTTAVSPNALSGFGIGLPLSRVYVRYLGGNLTVNSNPGQGTEAVITLPKFADEQVEMLPMA